MTCNTNKQRNTTLKQLITFFGLAYLLMMISPQMSHAEEIQSIISKPDIVTANYEGNSISILLGEHFVDWKENNVKTSELKGDKLPSDHETGDFNDNQNLDVILYDSHSKRISILHGNGDGSFAPIQDYGVGSQPVSIAVGNLN